MQRPQQVNNYTSLTDSCFSSIVYLYAQNDPVIESSSNLKFAPYNVAYPFLDQHAAQVGFDTSNQNPIVTHIGVNKWEQIFDFTKDDSGRKMNFELLDPSEFKMISKSVDGIVEQPVKAFPYPARYGGTVADDANFGEHKNDNNMMAFSIHTSQADAQKQVEVHEVEEAAVVVEEEHH